MIRRTAHLLATLHTNRVALELMNEPQYGWDSATAARWQRLLEHLHGEARAEAPELLLVLSGARGGDIKGLLALDPEPFCGQPGAVQLSLLRAARLHASGREIRHPERPAVALYQRPAVPGANADPDRVWHNIQQNILSEPGLTPPEKRRLAWREVRERVSNYFASGFSRRQIASDFNSVLV